MNEHKQKRSLVTWILLSPLFILGGGLIGYTLVLTIYFLAKGASIAGSL